MRRLLGLAVLFVVLSVSVPSYGYFLIYNLSGSVKGVNNNAPASISWKGYLVLKVNGDLIVDANLITYGKDSTNVKVYVGHVYDSLDITPSVHINIAGKDALLTIDLVCDTTDFDFEAVTVGTAKSPIDIGSGTNEWVASSAKGSMIVRRGKLLDPDDNIIGSGTVSSSLWLPGTKYVNGSDGDHTPWTMDQIINTGDSHQKSLTQMLAAKGFTNATP